jgi:hypothetical protein
VKFAQASDNTTAISYTDRSRAVYTMAHRLLRSGGIRASWNAAMANLDEPWRHLLLLIRRYKLPRLPNKFSPDRGGA